LIVNADDFGRHELINQAVERAFKTGCVRSATLMPGGAAFDDAVDCARRNPGLGVGIHFTLANGTPVLPPERIPSLVTKSGSFYGDYMAFLKRYARGKISLAEVRSELAAQLEKISRAGVRLTHCDSHQHLHHVPGITGVVLELAARANIPALRVARASVAEGAENSLGQTVGRLGLAALAAATARSARKKRFAMPDHFAGIVAGESISEKFMLDLIEKLSDGTTEVMLHPGVDNALLQEFCRWEHDFETELAAVTSPRLLNAIEEHNVSVISFAELARTE